MNKYPEAISYFKKALVLDPENDTYKSNLKIAEQKHKEATSPVSEYKLYLPVSPYLAHNIIYIPLKLADISQLVMAILMFECVPQIAAGLGFDMASLINNPAFISMVRVLITV